MTTKVPHTLFKQEEETTKKYRLFLDYLVHEGNAMHEILNTLHNAESSDTLEIRVNSGGGYVKYGQQLINVIRDHFKGRCATIIDAEASSMASFIFMAGDERIIYPHSIMMLHDVFMYLEGKSSESKKHIEVYQPVAMDFFTDMMGDTMSKKEINKVFSGIDYWFNAVEMCNRGIATKVIYKGNLITAKEYLQAIDPTYTVSEEYINGLVEEATAEIEAANNYISELKSKRKSLRKEL